jgi:hypothetical protein
MWQQPWWCKELIRARETNHQGPLMFPTCLWSSNRLEASCNIWYVARNRYWFKGIGLPPANLLAMVCILEEGPVEVQQKTKYFNHVTKNEVYSCSPTEPFFLWSFHKSSRAADIVLMRLKDFEVRHNLKVAGFVEEVISSSIRARTSKRVGDIGPWPNRNAFNISDQK